MGLKLNIFTGQLDFVGTPGGGSSIPNYQHTFNSTTDWGSPSGGIYTITIPVGTHGKGTNPLVQTWELVGSDYILIGIAIKVDLSGNVSIEVLQTPDNRFSGKLLIAENN